MDSNAINNKIYFIYTFLIALLKQTRARMDLEVDVVYPIPIPLLETTEDMLCHLPSLYSYSYVENLCNLRKDILSILTDDSKPIASQALLTQTFKYLVRWYVLALDMEMRRGKMAYPLEMYWVVGSKHVRYSKKQQQQQQNETSKKKGYYDYLGNVSAYIKYLLPVQQTAPLITVSRCVRFEGIMSSCMFAISCMNICTAAAEWNATQYTTCFEYLRMAYSALHWIAAPNIKAWRVFDGKPNILEVGLDGCNAWMDAIRLRYCFYTMISETQESYNGINKIIKLAEKQYTTRSSSQIRNTKRTNQPDGTEMIRETFVDCRYVRELALNMCKTLEGLNCSPLMKHSGLYVYLGEAVLIADTCEIAMCLCAYLLEYTGKESAFRSVKNLIAKRFSSKYEFNVEYGRIVECATKLWADVHKIYANEEVIAEWNNLQIIDNSTTTPATKDDDEYPALDYNGYYNAILDANESLSSVADQFTLLTPIIIDKNRDALMDELHSTPESHH
jgi:hypothetical protein